MVLVPDIFEHIGRIYSPLNLANMKTQICLEFVWITKGFKLFAQP